MRARPNLTTAAQRLRPHVVRVQIATYRIRNKYTRTSKCRITNTSSIHQAHPGSPLVAALHLATSDYRIASFGGGNT
eukprot:scaffold557720_cov22-Prasinocladus_malaysianus.AAC.1